jgi:hypothetical protein
MQSPGIILSKLLTAESSIANSVSRLYLQTLGKKIKIKFTKIK